MTEKLRKMLTKKTILLALCVYVMPYLLLALPKGVMVFILTSATIVALVGFSTIKEVVLGAYHSGINLYQRMGKIATMSEDEFSSRFQTSSPVAATASSEATASAVDTPVPVRRRSSIPGCCLVKPIAEEQAQVMARQWWDDGGHDRVEDLIQEISASAPQTHTCQLGDYAKQLALPKEKSVLRALELVMKNEGLCADYNADDYFVIFWGQDANGKEAGGQ